VAFAASRRGADAAGKADGAFLAGVNQKDRTLGARTRYYCRRLPDVARLSRDDRLAVLRRTAMRCRTVLASLVGKRREVDVPAPGSVGVDGRDRVDESLGNGITRSTPSE